MDIMSMLLAKMAADKAQGKEGDQMEKSQEVAAQGASLSQGQLNKILEEMAKRRPTVGSL